MGMLLSAQVAHSLILHRGIRMQIEPYIARKILGHTNQELKQAHVRHVVLRMHSASKWTEHATAVWQKKTLQGAEYLICSLIKARNKCKESFTYINATNTSCILSKEVFILFALSHDCTPCLLHVTKIGPNYPAFLFLQHLIQSNTRPRKKLYWQTNKLWYTLFDASTLSLQTT